jgi:ketosteroid isomerase-like protein
MALNRSALVLCVAVSLLASATAISAPQTNKSQTSVDEQAIWKLEHAYWEYVQANNLTAYLGLWHKDFLGWPAQNTAPAGKDHITDWITSQTAKGLALKSIEFNPARIQVTGDIAVVCYWITFKWLDKDGKGDPHTLRITHTWLKDGKDWHIIGGMSMPEPAPQGN